MRYLIHESQSQELSGRRDYLYDIFHLFFLPTSPLDGYIPLVPLGVKGPDILFITGHANLVENFLDKYISQLPERTIVATTCLPRNLKKYRSKKTIYVPNIETDYCYTHDGKPYGFTFNPTDAELDMYNANGDILSRIEAGYHLLK